jgi:creatinine amidohydrolase
MAKKVPFDPKVFLATVNGGRTLSKYRTDKVICSQGDPADAVFVGIPEEVYAGMLEGIARSLKAGGFKTICFIADHAGSLKPQAEVAERLSREWGKQGVRVIDVSDYYADAAETDYLERQGETPGAIGQHAGISDTSELMAVHPEGVDIQRYVDAPFALEPNGVSGDPIKSSAERGRALLNIKIFAAIKQIRALAAGP